MNTKVKRTNTSQWKKEKAQMHVFAAGAMSLFETDKIDEVKYELNKINFEDFSTIEKRFEFDKWFDTTVNELHDSIREFYRNKYGHAYSATAKLLSEYLSLLSLLNSSSIDEFIHHINIQHPIINRDFELLTECFNLYMISGIEDKNHYYRQVRDFRESIDSQKIDRYTLRILISFDEAHQYLPIPARAYISKLAFLRNCLVGLPHFLRRERMEHPLIYLV